MSHTPAHGSERVAFVGLGNLGYPMAINLAKWLNENGHPSLTVWTRDKKKLSKFEQEAKEVGATAAANLEEVVKHSDVIITSLSNDEAATEVYGSFQSTLKMLHSQNAQLSASPIRSKIFIDTSTLAPSLVGSLETTLTSPSLALPGRSISFICAPVFGPPPLAWEAKLILVLAGTKKATDTARRLLVPSVARKTLECGADVERAAKLKLVGNSMVLGVVEMLAETMTLADKSGVGAELLYEFLKEFFPTPSFMGYGGKMLSNSFDAQGGFTVAGGLKDAKHIKNLAAESRSPMPMTDIAYNHLLTTAAQLEGADTKDWSALVAGPRLSAGLLPFSRDQFLRKQIQSP